MLQLRDLSSSRPPTWLLEPSYILGLAEDCNFVLVGEGVVPKHAELNNIDDKLYITSLTSAAIVQVNGENLVDRRELVHGDKVRLGEVRLLVTDPSLVSFESITDEQDAESSSESFAEAHWKLVAAASASGVDDEYLLREGDMILGRAADCDISIPAAYLSRHHARLSSSEKGLSVEDLNSSNGTFVNAKRVKKAVLTVGDQLSFDKLNFFVNHLGDTDDKTSLRPALADISVDAPSSKRPARKQRKYRPSKRKTQESEEINTLTLLLIVFVVLALVGVFAWFLFA